MSVEIVKINALVNADVNKAWNCYVQPEHIVKWNFASDDWQCPWAENDLRIGETYKARMEAKDGSFGFDFWGVYDEIKENELIEYTMGDGRKAKISFINEGNTTKVIETFEAENENSIELQQGGWQAILNNFKKYSEEN
jgi:uncharacterized protein YndB with AHSA1/START domain